MCIWYDLKQLMIMFMGSVLCVYSTVRVSMVAQHVTHVKEDTIHCSLLHDNTQLNVQSEFYTYLFVQPL